MSILEELSTEELLGRITAYHSGFLDSQLRSFSLEELLNGSLQRVLSCIKRLQIDFQAIRLMKSRGTCLSKGPL